MSASLENLRELFVATLDLHEDVILAEETSQDELRLRVSSKGVDALPDSGAPRRSYLLSTHGVESFVSTLDNGMYRVDFEWEEGFQRQLIANLAIVARAYVSGKGRWHAGRRLLRKRPYFEIEVAGETYRFK